jgi:predicted kinase
VIKVQGEVFKTPNRQEQKRNKPDIKTLNIKNKETILKATKRKQQVTYQGKHIRIAADFSTPTLNARKILNDNPKENNCQPKLMYLTKLFLKK